MVLPNHPGGLYEINPSRSLFISYSLCLFHGAKDNSGKSPRKYFNSHESRKKILRQLFWSKIWQRRNLKWLVCRHSQCQRFSDDYSIISAKAPNESRLNTLLAYSWYNGNVLFSLLTEMKKFKHYHFNCSFCNFLNWVFLSRKCHSLSPSLLVLDILWVKTSFLAKNLVWDYDKICCCPRQVGPYDCLHDQNKLQQLLSGISRLERS